MTKLKFKICLFYLFTIFFSSEISAQTNTYEDDSIIYWSEDRKLTWDDFQGEIDTTHVFNMYGKVLAISRINIKHINSSNGTIVIAYFEKANSWTVTESKDVLEHEQLHFDIAELFARLIRKAFAELKSKNIFDQNYHSVLEKYRKEWDDYDDEFEKGGWTVSAEKTITEEGEEYALIESEDSEFYIFGQKYWKEKIYKELKELEAYKSPFVK